MKDFDPGKFALTERIPKGKITNQEQYDRVYQFGEAVKGLLKELDKDKEEIIQPIRKGLDRLYEKHRELRKPLEAAKAQCIQLMETYQTKKMLEAAKKIEKQAVRLEKKGAEEQAQDLRESVAEQKPVAGVGQKVTTVWAYEITAPEMVPISINGLMLRPIDEKVLRKVKGSGLKIPGVRFFKTKKVRL